MNSGDREPVVGKSSKFRGLGTGVSFPVLPMPAAEGTEEGGSCGEDAHARTVNGSGNWWSMGGGWALS